MKSLINLQNPCSAQSFARMAWGYNQTYRPEQTPVTIGGWTAIAWQEEERDYKYYSKAWHRQHGPKVTVTGRFVKFVSPSGRKTKIVKVEAWRGNWQAKALVDAGLVKAQSGRMSIRLNQACEIKELGKVRGITIYARSLKGELLDYVAVQSGKVYHSHSVEHAVRCIESQAVGDAIGLQAA
jgi:hypothetical protein